MVPNWLEEYAIQDDEFRRNGGEVWRDFKVACKTIVETYNKIYDKPESPSVVFNGCREITDNCFRVRTISQPERFTEVWFKPELKEIIASPFSSSVNGRDIQHNLKFTISKSAATNELDLIYNAAPIAVGPASKILLDPFLFPNNGVRPEPLNPPKKS